MEQQIPDCNDYHHVNQHNQPNHPSAKQISDTFNIVNNSGQLENIAGSHDKACMNVPKFVPYAVPSLANRKEIGTPMLHTVTSEHLGGMVFPEAIPTNALVLSSNPNCDTALLPKLYLHGEDLKAGSLTFEDESSGSSIAYGNLNLDSNYTNSFSDRVKDNEDHIILL